MVAKVYDLNFVGYWVEAAIRLIPVHSGIYGVYAATYNQPANTVGLNRLIYMGESENVNSRIVSHECWSLWRRQLRIGEIVCFNTAPISPADDRRRAEAAMIYGHKPVCNDEYKDSFPFEQTTITAYGSNALMRPTFTAYSMARGSYGAAGRRW